MSRKEWKNGKATDELMHPDCAELGEKNQPPTKDGKWVWYEMEEPLGLWINYTDPIIISCMEEHTQKQRFADRIAQTIVERNILKDHPAIGIDQVKPIPGYEKGDAAALVTVYGYQHNLDRPKMQGIMERAEKGDEVVDVKAETIDKVDKEEEEAVAKEVVGEQKEAEEKEFVLEQEEAKERSNE